MQLINNFTEYATYMIVYVANHLSSFLNESMEGGKVVTTHKDSSVSVVGQGKFC